MLSKETISTEKIHALQILLGELLPDNKHQIEVQKEDVQVNGLFTKKSLAEYLEVSIGTINNLIKNQEIEYIKLNTNVRFTKEAVEKYLEANKIRTKYSKEIKHGSDGD